MEGTSSLREMFDTGLARLLFIRIHEVLRKLKEITTTVVGMS